MVSAFGDRTIAFTASPIRDSDQIHREKALTYALVSGLLWEKQPHSRQTNSFSETNRGCGYNRSFFLVFSVAQVQWF